MTHNGQSANNESGKQVTNSSKQPLQSWKEIAAYLDRDERTAQRWEKAHGLPVRRHGEGKGSSVYAFPSEIDAWRASGEPRGSEAQRESYLRRWSITAAIGILTVLLVAWFIKYSPILNPPNPFVEAATGITVRQVLPGGYSEGGPSRDGRFFAFVDWATGDVAIEDLTTGERRPLTDEGSWERPVEYALWCTVSPDDTKVAYDWYFENENRTELRVVGRDGSNPRTLLGAQAGFSHETVSWSSDGRHIATRKFGEPNQILWVSVDDGSIRVLTTLGDRKWQGRVFHSPDDRYLVYSHTSKRYPPNYDVFLVATDGSGKTTALVEHPANDRALGWIPGREAMVFLSDRSGTWDVWLLEIANGQPKGDPKRVYTNVGNVAPIGFTNDGSFYFEVYSRWINNYIAALNSQTGKLVGPLNEPLVGYNVALDWSPDGRYLAYSPVRTSPEGPGFSEGSLCIRDQQTGEDRTIPCDLMGIFEQRWSPNGNALLVSGFRTREVVDAKLRSSLFSVDPQTGVTKVLVDRPKERIVVGEWIPNGSGFYYIVGHSVVKHDLESGLERTIYENSGLTGFLALSPQGERLVVGIHDPDNGASLIVFDVSSGDAQQLLKLGGPRSVRGDFDWSPDGRYVYYMKSEEKQGTSLWRVDTQSGTPEQLWQTDKRVGSPRIHPNGSQITFDEVTHETAVWVMEGFIPGSTASK